MNKNLLLFDNIKNKEWDVFEKNIKKEKEIDINIRDDSGNYLLNYLIVQNKPDLVKLLLDKGARIDITDMDGRSILFYCIKFRYNDILDLLLDKNKVSINIPITDIIDSYGQIPIFYAVQFKNKYALKRLLDSNSPVDMIDRKGMNCLHYSIYIKDYDICKLIIDYDADINRPTRNGDNALHIACIYELNRIARMLIDKGINVNYQDYEHEFAPLHYLSTTNNTRLTKYILDRGGDKNVQDYIGNTPLHYIIKNNYEELLDIFLDAGADVNIFNYKSNLPIHMGLLRDASSTIIKKLIAPSNLNYQNINGDTPLHIIVKNKLWGRLRSNLLTKKLNIFIKNNKGIRPIDLVDKKDIDEFLNMATDSYYYVLKNHNNVWAEEWEESCRKEIKDHDESKCKDIINKRLHDLYKSGHTCTKISYPVKKGKRCIKISEQSNVEFCSFAGTPLEVYVGMIYLINKHKNVCRAYAEDLSENENLCNYYRRIGVYTSTRCEFLNYEIVWINKRLFLPKDFDNKFNQCLKDDQRRFIIFPIGIELDVGNHSNYLIYDKKINEVERFEPYGSSTPFRFNYLPNRLDNELKLHFKRLSPNIRYVSPTDYLPKVGFQSFDSDEIKTSKIGDPQGFCALWSVWYTDYRLMYPDINRKKLVKKILKDIKMKRISFKNLIRNYSKDIINMRDKILSDAGININDWINDNYTEEQAQQVIQNISYMLKR